MSRGTGSCSSQPEAVDAKQSMLISSSVEVHTCSMHVGLGMSGRPARLLLEASFCSSTEPQMT